MGISTIPLNPIKLIKKKKQETKKQKTIHRIHMFCV